MVCTPTFEVLMNAGSILYISTLDEKMSDDRSTYL